MSLGIDEVAAELAPTRVLRVAFNLGNTALVRLDSAGEPTGVAAALARELVRRVGLEVDFACFSRPGDAVEALERGAADVTFVAVEPERARGLEFSPPYVLIDGVYAAPLGSAVRSADQVDRPGLRVAVEKGTAYDLFLSRTLKHASLIHPPGGGHAVDELMKGRADVVANIKPLMRPILQAHPEVELLPGRFTSVRQAIGVPRRRALALRYLHSFVEDVKASGFVRAVLDRDGQNDLEIAPAEPDASSER